MFSSSTSITLIYVLIFYHFVQDTGTDSCQSVADTSLNQEYIQISTGGHHYTMELCYYHQYNIDPGRYHNGNLDGWYPALLLFTYYY